MKSERTEPLLSISDSDSDSDDDNDRIICCCVAFFISCFTYSLCN